jgi:hypothetical protein
MKKMLLLLLVSGLLIASMAGSAMAQGGRLDIVDENGNSLTGDTIILSSDGVKDIYLDAVSVRAGTDRFNVVITRTDVPGGVIHLSANPLYQDLVFPAKGARVISTTPIVLTMSGAEEGETYDVTVSGTTLKVQATAEVASVPEFPTVALPVAAMLGLLFVFGRKKEGL